MTITPYEPNPAKAIAECKGDINKLAMELEIAKSSLAFALCHIEALLAELYGDGLLEPPLWTLSAQNAHTFFNAAKHKNSHVNELAQKYEAALIHMENLLHVFPKVTDYTLAKQFFEAAKFKNGEVS